MPDHEVLAAYDRAGQPGDPSLIPRAHLERMPERSAPRWPWVIGGLYRLAVAAGVVGYVSEYGFALPWGRDEGADLAGAPANVGVPASSTTSSPAATSATPVPTGSPMQSEGGTGVDRNPRSAGPCHKARSHRAPSRRAPSRSIFDSHRIRGSKSSTAPARPCCTTWGLRASTRKLTAAAPLSVTIGNAPAVQLTINGKPVPLPAPEAGQTVIRVRIDAAGTLR
jgi:hypothetical protein